MTKLPTLVTVSVLPLMLPAPVLLPSMREDNRIARCTAGGDERNGQSRGIGDRRSGLCEVDGLREQRVHNDGSLHLRSGGVIRIPGLVGVDDRDCPWR